MNVPRRNLEWFRHLKEILQCVIILIWFQVRFFFTPPLFFLKIGSYSLYPILYRGMLVSCCVLENHILVQCESIVLKKNKEELLHAQQYLPQRKRKKKKKLVRLYYTYMYISTLFPSIPYEYWLHSFLHKLTNAIAQPLVKYV